ncbi:MAG: S1C family serine protease [Oscillospiraceae bacterium]|jgi:serine protease Do|nr:S1C family serine protease [Oscillospiraceae bacterium]
MNYDDKKDYFGSDDEKGNYRDFNDNKDEENSFKNFNKNPYEDQQDNQDEWNTVYDAARSDADFDGHFDETSGEYHYTFQRSSKPPPPPPRKPKGGRENKDDDEESPATSSPVDARTLKKKSTHPSAFNFLLVSIGSLAVLLLIAFGVYKIFSTNWPETGRDEESQQAPLQIKEAEENSDALSVPEVFRKCSDSVLTIEVTPSDSPDSEPVGWGSGVVIAPDAIVTNAHVVTLGGNADYKQVVVTAKTQHGEVIEVEVMGIDVKTDLAVLKVARSPVTLKSVQLLSREISVGEKVVVIGNPHSLTNTLTSGVLSAKNRLLPDHYIDLFQTDSAINQGNSGGGLFDMYGALVGITSSKIGGGNEGLGFAVPANWVKQICDQLYRFGRVKNRAALGVTPQSIPAQQARQFGAVQGVMVAKISNQSVLDAGVKKRDIITKINDMEVKDASVIHLVTRDKSPGDQVKLSIFRLPYGTQQSSTFEVTVTLIEDKP